LGVYHYSGAPATNWYEFARAIFKQADALELINSVPKVSAIATADYPTRAIRPLNSVLDCKKITSAFGIGQPDWRKGLANVLTTWKQRDA
jgi:dTDP-4-dehydrorhamnose reductase